MTGRPLRFLVLALGGWTGARVAVLWPTIESVPALIRAIAPPVAAATAFYAEAPQPPPRHAVVATAVAPRPVAKLALAPAAPRIAATPAPLATPPEPATPLQPAPLRLPALAEPNHPNRLATSLWAIVRDGPAGARPGSQLGGSQAGMRITYALGRSRRVALSARLSTPLAGDDREGAIGLDWQPTAAPVHLLVEQRIAIGPGRGGPAALVVAGLDPRPLAAGLRIEAYAQAGAVIRDRLDAFADGAARLTRPVARIGGVRIDLGLGAWAGAQRGAARVDIGPTAAIALPVSGRSIRLTAEWRQRIAGQARPGSGPAVTIGTDL